MHTLRKKYDTTKKCIKCKELLNKEHNFIMKSGLISVLNVIIQIN